jgi:hypothetical protein
MGQVDVERQRPNVFWMERLGAEVVPVREGSRTLKDAINEAFRDWVTNMADTHYVLGTACGPHPFPEMVSYFQSIIGYVFKKLEYPVAPLVLAMVLGDRAEVAFRQSMLLGGGSLGVFWGNGIAGTLSTLALLIAAYPFVAGWKSRRSAGAGGEAGA